MHTFKSDSMNEMAEVSSSAACWSMIESAWHCAVVLGDDKLWPHFLALLILKLEVCYHLLDQRNGVIVR